MSAPGDDGLTIALVARVPEAGVAAFQKFEAIVIPRIAAHGGRLERRLRNADGTVEIHIVSFPSEAAFESFRNDRTRTEALEFLTASEAATEAFVVADVA